MEILAPPQTPSERPLFQPTAERTPPRTDRPSTAYYPQLLSLQTNYSPPCTDDHKSPKTMFCSDIKNALSVELVVTMGKVGSLDAPSTTPPRARFLKETSAGGVTRWRSLSHQNEQGRMGSRVGT